MTPTLISRNGDILEGVVIGKDKGFGCRCDKGF